MEAAVDDLYLYESQFISSIDYDNSMTPNLLRVTDVLGRDVDPNLINKIVTLIYIYDNGKVIKVNRRK